MDRKAHNGAVTCDDVSKMMEPCGEFKKGSYICYIIFVPVDLKIMHIFSGFLLDVTFTWEYQRIK